MQRKPLTPAEKEIIEKLYPNTLTKDIAIQINRPESSIYAYANNNGIYKSVEFLASGASGRHNVLKNSGIAFRYPKGHVPFNKGRKMSDEMRAKLAPSMFKKGHIPGNAASGDGVISIRKDTRGVAYKHIRVSLGKWVHYHAHLWHQINGTYNTSTHCLWFINGNTLDVRIENLELITRGENARRNGEKYRALPPELKKTHKLIKQLKSKIKKHGNTI